MICSSSHSKVSVKFLNVNSTLLNAAVPKLSSLTATGGGGIPYWPRGANYERLLLLLNRENDS
jgi:hypothetical protein